jgi:hypothetical protein
VVRIAATVARAVVRVSALALLALGSLFWTGHALALIPVHMLLGIVLVLALWTLAGLAVAIGVGRGLAAVAIVWGLVVPALGATQTSILPGAGHWVIQVLHLLVGLTAIALAELLGRRIRGRGAPRASWNPPGRAPDPAVPGGDR